MGLRLLGPVELDGGQGPVAIGAPKERLVLAVLGAAGGAPVSEGALVEALWADDPPRTAAKTVQNYVRRLRIAMRTAGIAPEEGIRTVPGGYALGLAATDCDVVRAEQLTTEAKAAAQAHDALSASDLLADALKLWRGVPLGEFSDCAWAATTSARLLETRWAVLEARIDADLALGRHAELIGELESACAEAPFRESLCGHLMVALYRSGRQADALRAYQRARTVLSEELGLEPTPTLRALHQAVIDQDPALDLPSAAPTRVAPPQHPTAPDAADQQGRTTLPRYRTSLIGRDSEIGELADLIAAGTLVTLTGTGGAGKTRLAVEVGHHLQEEWPDGVVFVDLASTAAHPQVGPSVLRALGASAEPGKAWQDTLARFVARRRMLVVVDNCEHVLAEARAAIDLLLDASPNSAVLATSREPLAAAGERIWPVPPLPTAGTDSPAAQLLRERAIAANPSFTSGPAQLVALSERLGGLPLAVEIVAPWTRTLSLAEIDRRLDDILDTAGHARPSRQQTLRATFEWSERLLDDAHRSVFRQLGVFVGGFDLTAAEAVVSIPTTSNPAVLQVISHLVDASLIETTTVGTTTRFRLLEPVRQFALDRLEESDASDVRDRHLAHYLALSTEAEPHLHLTDADTWCRRLETEEGNLGVALTWALQSDHDEAARLAANLWWYWWLRARTEEGIKWLERVVAAPIGDATAAVRSHIGLAGLLLQADRRTAGQAAADEAVTLARASGDIRLSAHALGTVGRIALDTADYERADQFLDEALHHYRQIGSRGGQAWVLLMLAGGASDRGRDDTSAQWAAEGRALFEAKGDSWGVAWCESILSRAARAAGAFSQATELATSAVTRFETLEVKDEGIVRSYVNLGAARAAIGDTEGALVALDHAERYAAGLADSLPYEQMLEAIADVAALRNASSVHARCQTALRELRLGLGRTKQSALGAQPDEPSVGRQETTPTHDTARTLLDDLIQPTTP